MFGGVRIGSVRGIPIRLHLTLIVVVALLIREYGWMSVPAGILLLGSVFLHELGHAVVAQRYGIPIASIDLHLLGGMALMTRAPPSPKKALWIAAAGPLVSLVLGIGFKLAAWLAGVPPDALPIDKTPVGMLVFGAAINLLMGIFNLIPALPMDGGRILQALLWPWLGRYRATVVAVWVARAVFALMLVYAPYVRGPQAWMFAVLAVFLLLMTQLELRTARALEAQRLASAADPARQTREEFHDPHGRRYVVVTRIR